MRLFGRRRRQTTLSMLARSPLAPGAAGWTTRCRAGDGRPSTVVVRVLADVVTLEGPDFGLVYLSPLELGRLRSVLRDAIIGTASCQGRHRRDDAPVAQPARPRRGTAAGPAFPRAQPLGGTTIG